PGCRHSALKTRVNALKAHPGYKRGNMLRPILIAILALASTTALADDVLKISVGARGAFDNQVSEVGQQQGFFKKRGLELEVLYTQGGGETLTTVIAGAVDVGISIGTLGALGAYAKGAPIR